MPFLHSFCTWFSIRMGSLVAALISLVQSTAFLILLFINIALQDRISSGLKYALNQYDLLFAKPWIGYIHENIRTVTLVVITFVVIHICSSICLIFASNQLRTSQIWPFILCDFVRLLLMTLTYAVSIIVIRKNILDFNIIFVCLTVGGFYLLFQYYLWLCPISLLQSIVNIEKKKLTREKKIDVNRFILPNYQSDFQFKPILPNRNFHQFQYGNLPKLYF